MTSFVERRGLPAATAFVSGPNSGMDSMRLNAPSTPAQRKAVSARPARRAKVAVGNRYRRQIFEQQYLDQLPDDALVGAAWQVKR